MRNAILGRLCRVGEGCLKRLPQLCAKCIAPRQELCRGATNSKRRSGSAVAVVLDPGGTQARQTMFVDGCLPVEEFVDAQRVTGTRLLERQKSTAHGSHDFGYTTDHPAARILWREIGNGQLTSVGTNDVLHAGTHLDGHFTH